MINAMRYPGGKGGDGVYHRIINAMPDHHTYIETHFGGGNIFYRKKPASKNILIDIDPAVTQKIAMQYSSGRIEKNIDASDLDPIVINCDAAGFLKGYPFIGGELVYCDPPYMLETRTVKKIYNFEYTDADHEQLLSQLNALPAGVNVMVSGYRAPLYDAMLATNKWNRIDYRTMTRGGTRIESLWMNFAMPDRPFDSRYIGENFRARERIKRIQTNLIKKIKAMPAAEKKAMLDLIKENFF